LSLLHSLLLNIDFKKLYGAATVRCNVFFSLFNKETKGKSTGNFYYVTVTLLLWSAGAESTDGTAATG
jgi:hypothetical protein